MYDLASANRHRVVLVSNGRIRVHRFEREERKTEKVDKSDEFIMNFLQEKMYNRLTKGLAAYTQAEQNLLSTKAKKTIQRNFEKSRFLIRRMKVDRYYKLENKLIAALFPSVTIGSNIGDYYTLSVPYEVTLTKLGITKRDVVDEFIVHKLLPEDFYSIDPINNVPNV